MLLGAGPVQFTREITLGEVASSTHTMLQLAASLVQLTAGLLIALRHRLRLPAAIAYGALGTVLAIWSIVDNAMPARFDWSDLGVVVPIALMLFAACQPLLTAILVGRVSSGYARTEALGR